MKKFFSKRTGYKASSVLAFALAFLILSGSAVYAALTLSSTDITSSGDITLTGSSGDAVTVNGNVTADVTRATGATGSFQSFAGDLTYEGAAGGTSAFHAGVMGHFHGNNLTSTDDGYHAGVIGGYSVLTDDDITGPKAGVVGFIGADGASGEGDAAVMAVLEGDGGVNTANAAYGVQYLNSTSGSKFTYGLDLSHAAAGYAAVTYGTADIRLANGTTISSGTARPATCVKGSLFTNTTAGTLNVCLATDDWATVTAVDD